MIVDSGTAFRKQAESEILNFTRQTYLLRPSQYEISTRTPSGTILKRLSDLTSNPTNKCGRSRRLTRSTQRDNKFLVPCGYLYTRRTSMGSCRSVRHAWSYAEINRLRETFPRELPP